MDQLIQQINDLDILEDIGDPTFSRRTKRSHLRGISKMENPINNEDLTDSKNRIRNIPKPQVEIFSRFLNQLKEKLDNFYQSEHGLINVGSYYSKYTEIKTKSRKRVSNIMNNNDLTNDHKAILVYCLLPIYYLPDYDSNFNPDKPTGEKTFSKMLLNLAVMQAKTRSEYISGMWDYHQQYFLV
ncbi:hypothetical protein DLAC_04782 [Tieghemostelium lacteum]|uniref:Uncharacterized protein n=1 Tax=Tieghemostelium lacteum TaxID=361077 RepID=A0A151ZKQ4_TIELA|nr:hypothetical protein DLAC_04782 [Tieghemostelium lacteum]|eukprot:KYQ94480.1 hypothetical protein DLAC_04782 [Tieghemostelium lacteum]